MQSQSEENYLKAIYQLSLKNNDKVTITALAAVLSNNPASVIDMLKKLTDKGFAVYDKINGVRLNETGKLYALSVIRRHRLWEYFLQNKLGYTWDKVHEIAEQLEHVHYEDLADRLDEFLEFPQFDPHGDPIPDKFGKFPEIKACLLSEFTNNERSTVVGLTNMSTSFLEYLNKIGIGIGTEIEILEKFDFDSSMDLKINNETQIHLSQLATQNILIGTYDE